MVLNYSVYTIPAYWFLSIWPHKMAVDLVKQANNGYWENRNSRGIDTVAMYKKALPADVFAKYEKVEAAHKNGMENLPLFIGAVVLGNMAKLSPNTLNTATGVYLVLRVLYTYLYINVTKPKYSYSRSAVWGVSTLILLGIIVKSGNVLAHQAS